MKTAIASGRDAAYDALTSGTRTDNMRDALGAAISWLGAGDDRVLEMTNGQGPVDPTILNEMLCRTADLWKGPRKNPELALRLHDTRTASKPDSIDRIRVEYISLCYSKFLVDVVGYEPTPIRKDFVTQMNTTPIAAFVLIRDDTRPRAGFGDVCSCLRAGFDSLSFWGRSIDRSYPGNVAELMRAFMEASRGRHAT